MPLTPVPCAVAAPPARMLKVGRTHNAVTLTVGRVRPPLPRHQQISTSDGTLFQHAGPSIATHTAGRLWLVCDECATRTQPAAARFRLRATRCGGQVGGTSRRYLG
jgi:hypothetical protein